MRFQKLNSCYRDTFQKFWEDAKKANEFLKWLTNNSPKIGSPTIHWEDQAFRITFCGYHPLAIEGSLASGGRFNIGGAQVNHFFPNIEMQGMLY